MVVLTVVRQTRVVHQRHDVRHAFEIRRAPVHAGSPALVVGGDERFGVIRRAEDTLGFTLPGVVDRQVASGKTYCRRNDRVSEDFTHHLWGAPSTAWRS